MQSVKSAEHQTLTSIHLHDNGFNLEMKDSIMKKVGIETASYHKLLHNQNLEHSDIMEQSILQRAYLKHEKIQSKVHNFFKQTEGRDSTKPMASKIAESRLLNHQINSDTK